MELLDRAERFVSATFSEATTVVMAGSSAHGTRTSTSDTDLLVIGPTSMFPTGESSQASWHLFEGEAFEVFAYTNASFDEWARRGLAERRPVIAQMLVEGIAVRSGSDLGDLHRYWSDVLAGGPEPTRHEIDLRRYALTDLVDDLADATDPAEARLIEGMVFQQAGELMLLSNRHWIARGKHLPRRLRVWDHDRAERLIGAFLAADVRALVDCASDELDRVGGRVRSGFIR